MNNLTKRFFLMVLSVSFLGLSAEAWAQSILLRRYRGDVEITNSQGRNLTSPKTSSFHQAVPLLPKLQAGAFWLAVTAVSSKSLRRVELRFPL